MLWKTLTVLCKIRKETPVFNVLIQQQTLYHGHKRLRQLRRAQGQQHNAGIVQQPHRSLGWFHSWETAERWNSNMTKQEVSDFQSDCVGSHPYMKAYRNLFLPGCNAKRCGARWGWTFSSRQHLERSSSASQNTLWGALAWRCQEPERDLVVIS